MKNRIEIEKQYNDWIDKACDFVDLVGPTINMPAAAMQSNISTALGNKINIMFLGHDAHEADSNFKFENSDYFRDRCKTGNVCWEERNEKWAIWKNLRDGFIKAFGESTIMDDLDHLVFTNAIFFTGNKIYEVLDQIGTNVENSCIGLTRDLIFDILQPKFLVCFSVKDVFDKLVNSIRKREGLNIKLDAMKFKPYHIKHTCAITQVDSTIILGIPHPSGAHGVLASLPAIVRIINDMYKGCEIEKVVATKDLYLNHQETKNYKLSESEISHEVKKEGERTNNELNSIIEKSFKGLVMKKIWNKEKDWYRISSNFIVKVTSTGGGYVSIRDSKFDNKNNYSKRTINNQNAIIKHLEDKGYELKNDGARRTSLGHKPFRKYAEWKQGPQFVVLSILKEIDELGPELEEIYNQKDI